MRTILKTLAILLIAFSITSCQTIEELQKELEVAQQTYQITLIRIAQLQQQVQILIGDKTSPNKLSLLDEVKLQDLQSTIKKLSESQSSLIQNQQKLTQDILNYKK